MGEKKIQSLPQVDEVKLISNNVICYACGQTGIGGRKENQDTYGGFANDNFVILTVCDGMGGMAGGQTASYIAVSEIIKSLAETINDKIPEAIRNAVENANKAIYQRASEEPSLRGMGTTATILVLTSSAAFLTHIGDSRIYQLRKKKKIFRTFDHSRVFEMVSQGILTEEQARQHGNSNIITRALGIRPNIDLQVVKIPYKKGDRFILCCDGIWNTEPEKKMLELFVSTTSPETTIRQLTEYVNSKGIERGCDHDNLTAIIADMNQRSEYQYNFFDYIKFFCISICKKAKRVFRKNK